MFKFLGLLPNGPSIPHMACRIQPHKALVRLSTTGVVYVPLICRSYSASSASRKQQMKKYGSTALLVYTSLTLIVFTGVFSTITALNITPTEIGNLICRFTRTTSIDEQEDAGSASKEPSWITKEITSLTQGMDPTIKWVVSQSLLAIGITNNYVDCINGCINAIRGEKAEVVQEFLYLSPKQIIFRGMPRCPTSRSDPSSYSNDHCIKITNVHLELAVDFNAKVISGFVVHSARVLTNNTTTLTLDSSFINVKCVTLLVKFVVHPREGYLGSPLEITFPAPLSIDQQVDVRIDYATTDQCTAIQWLNPSQTVGKKFPYLFSQCQAIHARSLVPCQDSPSIKIKYSANIKVENHFKVLMSAIPMFEQAIENGLRIFSFKQNIAIPSYLIAIAVGNIAGKRIGPRSTCWSEPEILESCAWEFQDTEKFIGTGEELLLPYCWGTYDLLVLPASFPYGGMENPCLTFVTPSLLAGDRSLVDVIAHEISHSWAGNLVTSASWEHFWLNEGFTVFIERKILGRLHSYKDQHFSAIIGYEALRRSVESFKNQPELTALVPSLQGVDPDDSFSSVPYEKGFNLLFYLEILLGGSEIFEPYVREHFRNFAHTSITTGDFKTFLYSYFEKKHGDDKIQLLNSVDWERWFKGHGMPPVTNEFDQSFYQACKDLAARWISPDVESGIFDPSDIKDFSPEQKMSLLEILSQHDPLPHKVIEIMGKVYKFGEYKNCEIKDLCLGAEYEPIFPQVVQFVVEIGRMKYVRPLYKGLYRCKNGKQLARDTFTKHQGFYHAICKYAIKKDLEL